MSDRPIQVGDLVAVVRACCTTPRVSIFRVGEIRVAPIAAGCHNCGYTKPAGTPLARVNDSDAGYPLPWLKRIPPLDELEGTKTDEPLKEPA